jgi:hypothetical protein
MQSLCSKIGRIVNNALGSEKGPGRAEIRGKSRNPKKIKKLSRAIGPISSRFWPCLCHHPPALEFAVVVVAAASPVTAVVLAAGVEVVVVAAVFGP